MIAIPKSANRARVRDNAGALALRLDAAQLAELDTLFVPPAGPSALAMI